MDDAVGRILGMQGGVVARRQALAAGLDDDDLERLLRRRDLSRVHPGVYVGHTGAMTWLERAWAAVLFHAPAALAGPSALRLHRTGARLVDPGTVDDAIHVVVATGRRLNPPAGVLLHRVTRFDAVVLANLGPPRVRVEHALLSVASAARSEAGAVAVLADGCQQGLTTPDRLATALAIELRLPRRRLLLAVVGETAAGVRSVLEHRYRSRVELPHGLPTGQRQRRVRLGRSTAYRDVEYRGPGIGRGLVVELDGRLGHEAALDRWADLDRDIAATRAGDLTVRLGWGQVMAPCRLGAAVGELLLARGWQGRPRSCRPGCDVEALS
ncbi:MAG: hypothetical protein ABIS35_12455 [Terracoccus sp.]